MEQRISLLNHQYHIGYVLEIRCDLLISSPLLFMAAKFLSAALHLLVAFHLRHAASSTTGSCISQLHLAL
jgi:hypothetical protein